MLLNLYNTNSCLLLSLSDIFCEDSQKISYNIRYFSWIFTEKKLLLSTHDYKQDGGPWIIVYCLCFVCVRLRISPPTIKLVASSFPRRFIGIQGTHILGNCFPPKAQNRTNRPARGPRTLASCHAWPARYVGSAWIGQSPLTYRPMLVSLFVFRINNFEGSLRLADVRVPMLPKSAPCLSLVHITNWTGIRVSIAILIFTQNGNWNSLGLNIIIIFKFKL